MSAEQIADETLEQELASYTTFIEAGAAYMFGGDTPEEHQQVLSRALELASESREASSLLEILPDEDEIEMQEHADRVVARSLELATSKAELDLLLARINRYVVRLPNTRVYYEKLFARVDELSIPKSA